MGGGRGAWRLRYERLRDGGCHVPAGTAAAIDRLRNSRTGLCRTVQHPGVAAVRGGTCADPAACAMRFGKRSIAETNRPNSWVCWKESSAAINRLWCGSVSNRSRSKARRPDFRWLAPSAAWRIWDGAVIRSKDRRGLPPPEMRADKSIVLIDFSHRTTWGRLSQRYHDRYFRATEADENVFRWCADLAVAGHRLVLFMTTTVLARHHRDIVEHLFQPQCAATVLLEFDQGMIPTAAPAVQTGPHLGIAAGESSPNRLVEGAWVSGLELNGLGTIMVPSSAPVLEQMLGHALQHPGPCLLTLSEHDYAPAELPPRPVFPGKADLLADGSELVLLAVGQAVAPALSAARELTVEGISTAVIDVRSLRPLDSRTLLASFEPAQAVVLLDDPSTPSGFVELLLEFYEARRLTPPVLFMPTPLVYGHRENSDRQKTAVREIVGQCQQFLEVVHTRAESSSWQC